MTNPIIKNKQNLISSQIEIILNNFDKIGMNILNIEFEKCGYPNYDQYMYIPGQHDISKWLQAIKEIYYREKNGLGRKSAIQQTTSGWALTEIYDFLNWLKFYEEGAHMKYKKANKTAQVWYENGAPGYFLPIKQDPPPPNNTFNNTDFNSVQDSSVDEMPVVEKKKIIERQRQKIIGRLDSAEKLLRTPEGQFFAGKELESLIDTIYSLKKKIQLVNKLSSSVRLYEDMIIREANILNKKGFFKAAAHLVSLADDAQKQDIPSPTPPDPPSQGSGAVGGLPSMGPGMPQNPPDSAPNENPPTGISKFLENLETGNITTVEDKSNTEDNLEIDDMIEVNDSDDELITEAQAVGAPEPAPKVPAPTQPPATENPLEVKENELGDKSKNKENPQAKNFDSIIDAALANVSINDVVAKLEDLAKIFKNREIPRQLAIVDMMLDSLGLAAFFSSLSEATNKALESNNYISIRIEEILSKLRGAMESKDIDLRGEETNNPATSGIKNKLQQDQDKEKTRKQMRKEQENAELDAQTKQTPEVEISEDLGAPPTNTPAKPAPSAPNTPPIK